MGEAKYFLRKAPSGFGGLSSSVLKIIAIVTMLCDHASCVFLGLGLTPLRIIGRIACPLFAFMIAEGARRTHNIKKYMLRLFIFAIVSEVPFDIALRGHIVDPTYQNVFFTLLLGLAAIYVYTLCKTKHKTWLCVPAVIILMFLSEVMCADYGAAGVLSIFLFYIFADKKLPLRLIGYTLAVFTLSVNFLSLGINTPELYALPAVLIIMLYNGEKGFKINKYFFYGFYPGHLVILYMIHLAMFRFAG